jgi:hypothetical protein
VREVDRRQEEAVASACFKPVLEVVGDLNGRVGQRLTRTNLLGDLAGGQLVSARLVQPAFDQRLVGVGVVGVEFGQGRIEVDLTEVEPALLAQKVANDLVVVEQLVVVLGPLFGLGLGRRGDHRQARQHAQLVGRAAVADQTLAQIVVVGFGLVDVAVGREDHVGDAGREVAPVGRLASLNNDRMALGRARNVERAAHFEPLALVVDGVDALGLDLAIDKGVVLPAIPQLFDQRHHFASAVVAGGVFEMLLFAEVEGDLVAARVFGDRVAEAGHNVPSRPPVADMVDRGEFARQLVGFVVGRRDRGGEADMLGVGRQRGQQGERIGAAVHDRPEELLAMFAHHQSFAKEDEVDQAALGCLGEAHVGLEFGELGVLGIAPSDRMSDALQEDSDMELFFATHLVSLSRLALIGREGFGRRTLVLADRARQAELIAQCGAAVSCRHETEALQLWHELARDLAQIVG